MNKKRFIQQASKKLSARWHMSLMCLTTIAFSISFNQYMLWFFSIRPMVRYGIVVIFSYAVFLLLIYWWLKVHFDGIKKQTDQNESSDWENSMMLDSASEDGCYIATESTFGFFDSFHTRPYDTNVSESPDFENIIFFLIIGFFFVFFGSAGYLVYQAPEILFEAAFEVVLAAGLIKHAKKAQSGNWFRSIFKSTWWVCAAILFLALSFGYFIQKKCPEAMTFSQYVKTCMSRAPIVK